MRGRGALHRVGALPHRGRHELHGRGRVERGDAGGGRGRDRRHARSPSAARRAPTTASPRPRWKTASARATSSAGPQLQRPAAGREPDAELLRFATAGSVDDGKSTLIGRLLYDSKSILSDQLEQVEEASRRRGTGGPLDLSLLTDGLRAEREQGITIDVAYRYFATPRRKFIIADTPGHEQYTRNMVTGASTADLADRADRRPQRRRRAVPPPRLHRLAAGHPARRRLREQDGPRRLRRGRVRPRRRGLRGLRRAARRPRRHVHPDLRAARRQRRRALAEHALVPGPAAALPPRARPHRVGSQPDRRPLPGAVGDPARATAPPRLPRLRRPGRRRDLAAGRRGRRAALGRAHLADRGHRPRGRGDRRRRSRRCRSPCGSRTTSTSRAAT